MFLLSASFEFFKGIFSVTDVPRRFSGAVIEHSTMVLHGFAQKTVFQQKMEAGLFEVFEHQVICKARELDVLPTPSKPSFHLHISLDKTNVDAFVNGTDNVELKKEELNLFYLEAVNVAIIPKGKHCFFHISFNNDTLFYVLKQSRFRKLHADIRQKVEEAQKNKGGMINAPRQVVLDAYFMMLIQDIRSCCFNELATIFYREKKSMLMLEHFMRQLLPQKKNRIEVTADDVILLDSVKKYIKLYVDRPLTLQFLAQRFNISADLLAKSFLQLNGISVNHFIHLYRMESAAGFLAIQDIPLNDIPPLVGYKSFKSFAAAFTKYFNCSPFLFRYPL
ncbi:helix-turn-helix transcriptional regulator [Chitinophaga filiformis]|uniref:helix-turn-helix transcriptional regulator n=1 Tax=Chitinophaga filiformis TaxID=104663 RepID=UPI001F1C1248|nr:helix-turn-helix transcriptional regulator [Chitinophaga filiformis]MCF6402727.1 helix-turn-helix transcriptional regulator [Chitinophaga filiformis]MCF6403355.1 helix-turn-helix transcriptional regulator [Chitinophaga filiformis]